MKGMQKIKRGKSFAGVVLYALKLGIYHRSDPIVIGGNMLGDSALELIAEFDGTKQLRADVQKPVWHNSLRLPAGESLSNDQWGKIADDYMQRMGFSDTHLRCYVLHDDEAGQHIHIIASRIDVNGGRLYLGRNENLISTRIINELEIAHGLTVTKTAPSLDQPKRKRVSRNEKMLSERTGMPSPKEALQQLIVKTLADKPDLKTFLLRLEQEEVHWTANIASTGKMNGFSFEYAGVAFKASQLGKGYGWKNLQEKLDYKPTRDTAYLLSLRAETTSEEDAVEVDPFMQLAMNPADLPATIHPEPSSQQRDPEPVEAISIREAIEALSRKIQSFKAEQQIPQFRRSSASQHYKQTIPSKQFHRFIFTFKPFRFIYAILHRLPLLGSFKTFDEFSPELTSRKPPKIRM
ncbi:MAG: relaxase/mobilization nuclease domain-containing protein [Metakosakonia sp.]|nr:relaxase/mobilization nuclease domain-containing protein [Phytobacter sp.]MBV8875932.1 relaxase/mobilization nuclease domain-containing protein [Phytobacter sp.]